MQQVVSAAFFAFYLAQAGHQVSVVARGERLTALRQEGAIVTTDGRRAQLEVLPAIDPAIFYDLAIVTVPEHQLSPLLPQLAASQAKTILLMFNSFLGTEYYEAALGAARCAFGFPNMMAYLPAQKLRCRVDGPGMVTTVSSPELAQLFKAAGMPSAVENDMNAFLRSHAAMVVPLFLAALLTWQRQHNLTWAEARQLNAALQESLGLVRRLGHPLKPGFLVVLARMPAAVRIALLYWFSRSKINKDLGEFGPAETRGLIDAMAAVGPGQIPRLLALRPVQIAAVNSLIPPRIRSIPARKSARSS